jgi:membrane protein implicated in regulation of membrane protease activity
VTIQAKDVAEAAPAAGALVITLGGLPVDDWLKVLGLVFLVLQVLYLLWRWRRDVKRERRGHPAEDTTP